MVSLNKGDFFCECNGRKIELLTIKLCGVMIFYMNYYNAHNKDNENNKNTYIIAHYWRM